MREFLAYSLDRQPRSLAFLDEVRAGGIAVGPGRTVVSVPVEPATPAPV